jgi:hypothetical protein
VGSQGFLRFFNDVTFKKSVSLQIMGDDYNANNESVTVFLHLQLGLMFDGCVLVYRTFLMPTMGRIALLFPLKKLFIFDAKCCTLLPF